MSEPFDGQDAAPWQDIVRFYRANFNTELDATLEWRFHCWAESHRLDLDDELRDYDLRGAFKADGCCDPALRPDCYKKPNHVTFAVDSIYHGATNSRDGGTYVGGQWSERAGQRCFTPSPQMLATTHPENWLKAQMRLQYPDVELILPEGVAHDE